MSAGVGSVGAGGLAVGVGSVGAGGLAVGAGGPWSVGACVVGGFAHGAVAMRVCLGGGAEPIGGPFGLAVVVVVDVCFGGMGHGCGVVCGMLAAFVGVGSVDGGVKGGGCVCPGGAFVGGALLGCGVLEEEASGCV